MAQTLLMVVIALLLLVGKSSGFVTISSMKRMSLPAATIPSNGIIDYIGKTDDVQSVTIDSPHFQIPSTREKLNTQFNLWKQLPWKKIKGKVVLKVKIGGDLSIEAPTLSFFSPKDFESVTSLSELTTMFNYGAHDPRIQAVVIEIDRFSCGYAKLIELRRMMDYFRKSGKEIIGYCAAGAEKELFLSLSCDQFYIPPDGGLDLRGFSAAATFVRGVFEKIGLEPQVQRIGKYKSFGDTFNRTTISEAQREVISSLLMESSNFWAASVAGRLNKSREEVMSLWADSGIKSPLDFHSLGYVSGVMYYDQVEDLLDRKYAVIPKPSFLKKSVAYLKDLFSSSNDTAEDAALEQLNVFNLTSDFADQPRRSSAGLNVTARLVNISSVLFGSPPSVDTAAGESIMVPELQSGDDSPKPSLDGTNLIAVDPASPSNVYNSAIPNPEEPSPSPSPSLPTPAVVPTAKSSKKGKGKPEAQVLFGGLYLKKMRKGHRILSSLTVKEVPFGPRIGVINAVGGIGSGKSSSGPTGTTLGSDTIISLVRTARDDPGICAVVLRVDSPGGSALASDLMWREIRALAKIKPVVASMVDVAASGGYYISMACDEIVAETMTVTGSIGVVTSKFNAEELNKRIGLNVESLSRGRYAEVLSTSRGFTEEESAYFEEGAMRAYTSFITKAAASRSMSVDAMHEVAQGRVWTGRQAAERGLVDHTGGLWKALAIAASMSDIPAKNLKSIRMQTLRERPSGLKLPFGGASAQAAMRRTESGDDTLVVCDDVIASCGMASAPSLGLSSSLQALGVGPLLAHMIRQNAAAQILADWLTLSSQLVGRSASLGSTPSAAIEWLGWAWDSLVWGWD